MDNKTLLLSTALLALATPALAQNYDPALDAMSAAELLPLAQAEGTVAGRVRNSESGAGLGGAQVLVDDRIGAVADTAGRYRARAVRTGWHRVAARLIGYRGVVLDSVFVPAGATATR